MIAKLWECIFRRKRLKRLEARAKQFDSLLASMQRQDYMNLHRLEKAILFAALTFVGFRHRIHEPRTKYIERKTYALLEERLKKELRA